jgi:hypothetical protein
MYWGKQYHLLWHRQSDWCKNYFHISCDARRRIVTGSIGTLLPVDEWAATLDRTRPMFSRRWASCQFGSSACGNRASRGLWHEEATRPAEQAPSQNGIEVGIGYAAGP